MSLESPIRIRPAREDDAAAIADIHSRSWRDAYAYIPDERFLARDAGTDRLEHWTRTFSKRRGREVIAVAEAGGEVVGFVHALANADPELGNLLDNLHVSPSHRGNGIGERLLRCAAGQLARTALLDGLYLWVFEANRQAVKFYLRLGGEIVGKDVSRLPEAEGQPALCIHWPRVARLI